MPYQVGQLVQCKRALHPGHIKLVGCIGEIKARLNGLEAFLYNCEYVVFFPNYPVGQCPYCDIELKPVEDPDQGKVDHTDERLPEELEA